MTNLMVLAPIAILGMALQATFITVEHKKKYVAADVFKGLAALMFVIIGFFGYVAVSHDSMGLKLLIGLAFGMIGDIVMNLRFIFEKNGQKVFLLGILAFLIGHVLYLLALIPIAVHLIPCIIIGAVAAAALLTYIFMTMDVKPAFKIFGIFYLGAIIIMTVISIDIAIATGAGHDVMYAIGAVLFTASDIVLIFNTFSGVTRFSMRITNLSLYYVGQLLIAGSLFLAR